MRDQPAPDYFPSARVRLILRFEDWGATDAPKGPAKPPQLRTGKKDEAPLTPQRTDGGFVLVPKGSGGVQSPGGPQGQLNAADDRTHVVEGIKPISCEVQRNGLREANTATVVLALADFPFDPRAIRSCAVEVYIGTVSPTEFQLGVEGTTHEDHNAGSGDPSSLSAVADTYLDPYGVQRSNKRFSGWVDEDGVEFSDGEQPLVHLECVDNTKLLADQDAPPKLTLSATLPIDEAVATYLANFPQCEGLEVELRPANADKPTLKAALAKSSFKPDLGPSASGSGKQSVLDYLSDCAMALGLMLWVEDAKVVLQRPRTLYATGAVRPNDPFTGRRLPSGRVLERRTLVWGLNLESLAFTKRFGRTAGCAVECRSYSGRQKRTLVARHPGKGDRQASTTPGGATDEKWKVHEVAGIDSEEALRAIAQAIYEASARHEMGVRFKTPALGSLGGGNEDPDLLDVETGDAIDVETTRGSYSEGDDAVDPGQAGDIASGSGSENARAYIVSLGYSEKLADAYVKAVRASAFPTTFRVKSWVISYNEDGSIQVGGELINYVEVRADKDLPDGEETPIDPGAGSPVRVSVSD